eukprot:14020755-Heterocapsa_arctica.AAC.1
MKTVIAIPAPPSSAAQREEDLLHIREMRLVRPVDSSRVQGVLRGGRGSQQMPLPGHGLRGGRGRGQ